MAPFPMSSGTAQPACRSTVEAAGRGASVKELDPQLRLVSSGLRALASWKAQDAGGTGRCLGFLAVPRAVVSCFPRSLTTEPSPWAPSESVT